MPLRLYSNQSKPTIRDVMSKSDDNYTNVLLEQILHKNDAILEIVSATRDELKRVPKREEFDELKQDVKTIRAAVTDQGKQVQKHERQLNDHERRLRALKAA
jgi:septal ring factor EnvC (AmiA/AmiB activator)